MFVKLIGMPVPGMREHRWEHPVAGLYLGFEGAGNSGHYALKASVPCLEGGTVVSCYEGQLWM